MIEIYKIEILKEFEFFRVGEIKKLFIYDYERILKLYPTYFKLIGKDFLK